MLKDLMKSFRKGNRLDYWLAKKPEAMVGSPLTTQELLEQVRGAMEGRNIVPFEPAPPAPWPFISEWQRYGMSDSTIDFETSVDDHWNIWRQAHATST